MQIQLKQTEIVAALKQFISQQGISLTGKIKRPAQVKVLNSMGISHRVRPDGSVAILRAHITKVFDGDPASARKPIKVAGPNWDAI